MFSLVVSAPFILVIGSRFMQIDPQLTIKLSIFFNFTPVFNLVESLKFKVFFQKGL
jgi:hypothetical protein